MSSDTLGAAGGGSTGGGFGYSGHSLDELRALAGSIDTGRIISMQGEFQNVAKQLDDVVTQLLQIRNDVPNWWQGPAADSVVAKFGPMVSHVQQTQTMASGAAHALQICSTVVGHQQEAMKQVPEVEDPNTAAPTGYMTPGDPFVARSAAALAHEQAYTAARGQAVGVVNGIAAQYVETTAQLQGLTGSSDESFQPINPAGSSSSTFTPATFPVSTTAHQTPQFVAMQPMVRTTYRTESSLPVTGSSTAGGGAGTSPDVWMPLSPTLSAPGKSPLLPHAPIQFAISDSTVVPTLAAGAVVAGSIRLAGNGRRPITGPDSVVPNTELQAPTSKATPVAHDPQAPAYKASPAAHDPQAPTSKLSPGARERGEPYLHYDESGRARFGSNSDGRTEPVATEREMLGAPSAAGIRAHPEKDERGRRPAYLKESKSAWLPNDSAAPHDGILTPDWADQQ